MKDIWKVAIAKDGEPPTPVKVIHIAVANEKEFLRTLIPEHVHGWLFIDYTKTRRLTNPIRSLPLELGGCLWLLSDEKIAPVYYDEHSDNYRHVPTGKFINPTHPWKSWCTSDDIMKVVEVLVKPLKEDFTLPNGQKVCQHGKAVTDYCEPCGRINGG